MTSLNISYLLMGPISKLHWVLGLQHKNFEEHNSGHSSGRTVIYSENMVHFEVFAALILWPSRASGFFLHLRTRLCFRHTPQRAGWQP